MRQLIEIVPKYVNEAKPGKKYGSVKLADDKKFLVPAAMISQLAANTPAKVETHTENWKDGPVDIINKVVGANGTQPAKQNNRASTSPRDAAHIATLALAKEYVARGDTPADDKHITSLLNKCLRGYMNSELAGKQAQTRDDMDDEIPNWESNSENPAD